MSDQRTPRELARSMFGQIVKRLRAAGVEVDSGYPYVIGQIEIDGCMESGTEIKGRSLWLRWGLTDHGNRVVLTLSSHPATAFDDEDKSEKGQQSLWVVYSPAEAPEEHDDWWMHGVEKEDGDKLNATFTEICTQGAFHVCNDTLQNETAFGWIDDLIRLFTQGKRR